MNPADLLTKLPGGGLLDFLDFLNVLCPAAPRLSEYVGTQRCARVSKSKREREMSNIDFRKKTAHGTILP